MHMIEVQNGLIKFVPNIPNTVDQITLSYKKYFVDIDSFNFTPPIINITHVIQT